MDSNQKEIIEQLANKMGTTSEYLWGILVKQAPIDSTITLVQVIMVYIFGYILYKLHLKFSIKEGEYKLSSYDKSDSLSGVMWIGFGMFVILAFTSFLCITGIVNGYLNPEYWALDRVLDTIKNK